MSLTENLRNVVLRSIRVATGQFIEGPAKPPVNAAKGGTTGSVGLQNNYGSGRGQPLGQVPDGRQWVAGRGTSQDRYATTRLPGDRL